MDVAALKVSDLKQELTNRGLSTKGLKKELVARLEEALAQEGSTSGVEGKRNEHDETPMETNDEGDNKANDSSDIKEEKEVSSPSATAATSDSKTTETELDVKDESIKMDEDAIIPSVPTTTAATPPLLSKSLSNSSNSTPPPAGTTLVPGTNKRSRQESEASTDEFSEGGGNGIVEKKSRADYDADHRRAMSEARDSEILRRSKAPSPSPAPSIGSSAGYNSTVMIPVRQNSMTTENSITEESTATQSASTATATAGTVGSDRRSINVRRFDARSLMERQIQMAAADRSPDQKRKSTTSLDAAVGGASDVPAKSVEAPIRTLSGVEPTIPVLEDTILPNESTRALHILNFVRPLTLSQVRRFLEEFGSIETLWMDQIKTHCYVIYNDLIAAQKAYMGVSGKIFPKETGRALQAQFVAVEAALSGIKEGDKPVASIRSRVGPPTAAKEEKKSVDIADADAAAAIPLGPAADVRAATALQPRIVATVPIYKTPEPIGDFKVTKTKPHLYFKAAVV